MYENVATEGRNNLTSAGTDAKWQLPSGKAGTYAQCRTMALACVLRR